MISEKEINLVELIRRETTKTTERIFREKKKKDLGEKKGKNNEYKRYKMGKERRSLKRVRMRIVKGNGK